jgi:hypothetical protein
MCCAGGTASHRSTWPRSASRPTASTP